MSTTVPKFISAEAVTKLTFLERIERIKKFFSPARGSTSELAVSKANYAEPHVSDKSGNTAAFNFTFNLMHECLVERIDSLKRLNQERHQLLSKPIPGGTQDVHVVEFPPEPVMFADYALPVDHEAAVIARVEIAQLSKPSQPTTKTKILTWVESFGGNGVSVEAMCNAFPEYTRGAISSRVSEMVRENSLIELGRFLNSKGAKVTFYTRAETN